MPTKYTLGGFGLHEGNLRRFRNYGRGRVKVQALGHYYEPQAHTAAYAIWWRWRP